ncbi:MAG TPA: PAS domain S-box protein, partial [Longimicrobium sp.]|nr:PAS domain S-box protein [Longimicrobium sp.]
MPPPSFPVVLLPEHTPLRERAARAVARAAAQLLPATQRADAVVALVDASAPGGLEALELLRPRGDDTDVAVIALVDWSRSDDALAAQERGASDLVSIEALDQELPFRLRAAHARYLARREQRRREKDLKLLLNLTADYAESLDVKEILHDVTRRLAETLNIDRASIMVVDEAREAGFVIAASDDAGLRDLRVELSRYPEIREVVRTGKPVSIVNAPTHPLLESVQSAVAARGIHALAAVPLVIRGKVLGVLLVRAASHRDGFSAREMDVLATVAHATAVALRNARLLETERGQVAREKSARIAAEERARQLQRYEAYFAHITEGIAILDETACVLSLNPAGAKLLDVEPQDARGRHIGTLTQPLDDTPLMDMLWGIRNGESRREIDVPARTLSGRQLTLALCAAPMHDGSGAVILSFRDVTVPRKMAEEMIQTKDFLERLIDSSVDAVVAADMRGHIILFNKGAEALSGYTAAEAISGLHVRQFYPPGVAERIMQQLRSPEHGGRGRLSLNRQDIMHRSGQRVPVNMTASIVYDGGRE